jgi:hypothetical protein
MFIEQAACIRVAHGVNRVTGKFFSHVATASKIAFMAYASIVASCEKSLGWPLPDDLDDAALERALFPQVVQREQYTPPDYAYVHQELKVGKPVAQGGRREWQRP